MINLLDHIYFCFFEKNQVLPFIFIAVVLEGLESCDILVAFSELFPVWQRKPVVLAVRKLLDKL